ncbi:efflux RND transporter periplasmic adaptor subunit [Silanimonas algicola]
MPAFRHLALAAAVAAGGTALAFTLLGGAAPVDAATAAAEPTPPAPPPAPVDVAPAVDIALAPLHWSPGSVASREDARIAAEIGGRVEFVADVGSRLAAGDVLARLDPTPLRLRERQAEADLARLRAQLDFSRKQEARYAALVRDGGIAGAQLDQVSAERRMREQDVAAAQVALEQARLQLRQATVRAPFPGVVVERSVQLGEFLGTGAPVARLVNPAALEVRTRAPLALAGHLRAGERVSLRDDDRIEAVPLATVVPVGDEASRQLELRVALSPAQVEAQGWVVGTAVQVGVPSDAPRNVVAVPRDALLLRKDGTYVVRVGEDGATERLAVETGSVEGSLVEVIGGVRTGDRLVVRGGERLLPGQRVEVRGAAERVAAR